MDFTLNRMDFALKMMGVCIKMMNSIAWGDGRGLGESARGESFLYCIYMPALDRALSDLYIHAGD